MRKITIDDEMFDRLKSKLSTTINQVNPHVPNHYQFKRMGERPVEYIYENEIGHGIIARCALGVVGDKIRLKNKKGDVLFLEVVNIELSKTMKYDMTSMHMFKVSVKHSKDILKCTK